jgi:hypothetical protein
MKRTERELDHLIHLASIHTALVTEEELKAVDAEVKRRSDRSLAWGMFWTSPLVMILFITLALILSIFCR